MATMKTGEIVQMYKEAKDKNAQIEILADLACCSKEDILLVLQNEGLISGVPGGKKKKKAATYQNSGAPRLVWDEELKQTVRSLLMEGMTITAIAERIGWDTAQVQYGISRYKLRGEAAKKEPAVKTGTPQTLAFEGEEEEQRIKRELSNEEAIQKGACDDEYRLCVIMQDALRFFLKRVLQIMKRLWAYLQKASYRVPTGYFARRQNTECEDGRF